MKQTRWPEKRRIYARCSWGRFCISLPRWWLDGFHSYVLEGHGVEFIATDGVEEIYVRPAAVVGACDSRPWEESVLPLRAVRAFRPLCPIIRKTASGAEVRIWIERTRVIGKSERCMGSVVVGLPDVWVDEQLNGRKPPDHVWVFDTERPFLGVALKEPLSSDKRTMPWGNATPPRLTVLELAPLHAKHILSEKRALLDR